MVVWLFGCLVDWFIGCLVVWLFGRLVVWLFGRLVVWSFGCLVAWLLGCLVAWLLGCLVVWLFGCLVVWLFGCLVVVWLLFGCCLVVVWLLFVCCLFVVCLFVCLLFVVCCLLFVVCCLLFVVCCLLFVVCCLLFVVCCLLFVVCCLLFAAAAAVVVVVVVVSECVLSECMSKRLVVQRQSLRLFELITCVMSSYPQLKASSRLPFPLCLQETATLSKSWTAPTSTTCTTGTSTSTLPPSLHTDGQKVLARLVPPDRAISGVVHDPPPREDLRPGPPAAEFIHPYAEVLQLRHRQRLSHHGGAISRRRPWSKVRTQFRPRVRTLPRTFFPWGKVRKKTLDGSSTAPAQTCEEEDEAVEPCLERKP